MYTTISEDQKVVLETLRKATLDALVLIKQESKELSFSLFIQLKAILSQFILSYKEYSLENIKQYGLGEILWMRALRFFKLEERDPNEERKLIRNIKRTKKGVKRIIRSIGKVLFFPLYLLLLSIIWIRTKDKRANKINNYVKNSYIE